MPVFAAFPLIFIKPFQRSWTLNKEGPETVPEADSDFEEITSAEKQIVCLVEFIVNCLTIENNVTYKVLGFGPTMLKLHRYFQGLCMNK